MSELADLFIHLGESLEQLIGVVVSGAQVGYSRLTTNVGAGFSSMDAKQWIRLVIIVGAYCLLRPYIIKLGAKQQAKQFEKEHADDAAAAEAEAKISPNALRGQVSDIPGDSDDEEEEGEMVGGTTAAGGGGIQQGAASTAADWGKKARKRQRTMLKKMIDAEEERLRQLQEDEEDKDIEQYLVG